MGVQARNRGGERQGRHLSVVPPETDTTATGGLERLAESHGFLVDSEDGTPIGVVDDVVLGPEGKPVALLVAVGTLTPQVRSVIPDEVVEIRPLERRLLVSFRPEPAPPAWWRRLFGQSS